MALSAESRRRTLGVIFLALAGGMLVLGQTLLAPRLEGVTFLVYWLTCFACTVLAILTALADLRAVRDKTRQAQRELVRETFGTLPDPAEPDEENGGPDHGKEHSH